MKKENNIDMTKQEVKNLNIRLKAKLEESKKEQVQIKVIKNFKEKVETIFINKRENGVVTFTYLVSPFAKEFIMTEEKLASITIK